MTVRQKLNRNAAHRWAMLRYAAALLLLHRRTAPHTSSHFIHTCAVCALHMHHLISTSFSVHCSFTGRW
jgi:hypothetical protein